MSGPGRFVLISSKSNSSIGMLRGAGGAMIDLPVELISISGIIIIWMKIKATTGWLPPFKNSVLTP
jgi:hypothetical protein